MVPLSATITRKMKVAVLKGKLNTIIRLYKIFSSQN